MLVTDQPATASDARPAIDAELVARFARELDSLVEPGTPVALAVSGGPDSLALLLLAAAAATSSAPPADASLGLSLRIVEACDLVSEGNRACVGAVCAEPKPGPMYASRTVSSSA